MSDKQLSVDKLKPVDIMGVRHSCYRKACYRLDASEIVTPPPRPNRTLSKYYSLEREELPAGFQETVVQKDYPINSDSVSSYLESSDYRNDPVQAIANAPKRVNLGDISEAQEFIKNSPVEATKQYADILTKVAQYFKNQSQVKTKEGEGNNG